MTMRTDALLLIAALLGPVASASTQECGDGVTVTAFLGYGSGSKEVTTDELRATFAPMLGCLENWVEDGGEKVGVPIEEWAKAHESPRLIYRTKAMELVDALVLLDAAGSRARIAAWILR